MIIRGDLTAMLNEDIGLIEAKSGEHADLKKRVKAIAKKHDLGDWTVRKGGDGTVLLDKSSGESKDIDADLVDDNQLKSMMTKDEKQQKKKDWSKRDETMWQQAKSYVVKSRKYKSEKQLGSDEGDFPLVQTIFQAMKKKYAGKKLPPHYTKEQIEFIDSSVNLIKENEESELSGRPGWLGESLDILSNWGQLRKVW